MSFAVDEFINQDPDFRKLLLDIKKKSSLSAVIIASLTVGLAVARSIASDILTQRGQGAYLRVRGKTIFCTRC